MVLKLKQLWSLIEEIIEEFSKDDATMLAGAVSFYTLVSIAPLVVLAISIAGTVFGEDAVRGTLFAEIERAAGADVASTLSFLVERAYLEESGTVATVLGLGALAWAATRLFASLQTALNQIWGVAPVPGLKLTHAVRRMVLRRVFSFLLVLFVGVLLLGLMIASTALSAVREEILPATGLFWRAVEMGMSWGVVTVLLAMIYRYLPDVRLSWHQVATGAVVTSVLFVIGKFLIGLYLGRMSVQSTYGAAGSIVLILFWVYYSAMVFFLGAEFTFVYSRRMGEKVKPEEGAMVVEPPPAASAEA